MLIVLIVFLIIYYAVLAYKDIYIKVSTKEKFAEKLKHHHNLPQNEIIKYIKYEDEFNQRIKTELQLFLQQHKIREDLFFFQLKNRKICSSHGTNFFKKSDAVIFIYPGFYEKNKASCMWIIKHEIAHIKNNDNFKANLFAAISSLLTAIFASLHTSIISTTLIAIIVGGVARVIASLYCEKKADNFAISNSTIDELKSIKHFLENLRRIQKGSRRTCWRKVKFSSKGENRFDFRHPTLSSRILKIKQALEQKTFL